MYEMTPERAQKFENVVNRRQGDLTVILENVHDTHNIGAVLRTCDSVGIDEIFLLYTDPGLTPTNIKLGKRTSAGARKWVTVHSFSEVKKCFDVVKAKYKNVYATHLNADAVGIYELDLSQPVALLFGNEHRGVSEEALALVDGNFIIPQVGMVESLNISVACAVSIYEAFRQRYEKGFYTDNPTTTKAEKEALLKIYKSRHKLRQSTFRAKKGD